MRGPGQIRRPVPGAGLQIEGNADDHGPAFTARLQRGPSSKLVDTLKTNPTAGAIHLGNQIPAQGALPIKVGEDTIGAIGVSGAPGGDKDEACAKAGIDKVSADLK